MPGKRYTPDTSGSAASKFGQMIGEIFEEVVIDFIETYIAARHGEYELLEAPEGRSMVTLEMLGGSSRQLDTVIAAKGSRDPVGLLETKWLKDARHHSDKGAWILQLREVKKRYSTVRGAAAIMVGYWTEGVAVVLMSEGQVNMVLVATDEEVYGTLQEPLNAFLGADSFELDPQVMKIAYPRPWDLANLLIQLEEKGELKEIASSWLSFARDKDSQGNPITGKDLIEQSINDLLAPLPDAPKIRTLQISLDVETGNTIYEEFEDIESALDFIQAYWSNPAKILERITPKMED